MIRLGLALALGLWITAAQAIPLDRLQILSRGANISTLFERQHDLNISLQQIAAVGFRHVRVFIVLDSLADHAYLARVNRLVTEATALRLGVILCMTSTQHAWKSPDVLPIWLAGWQRLASDLRQSTPQYVYVELANEPDIADPHVWDALQSQLRAAVRSILPHHTILLTGSPTSMVWSLVDKPIDLTLDDDIIYTIHLYQPMIITCQGCECCPQYQPFRGLAYPPDAANIQHMKTATNATLLDRYQQTGRDMMAREIDAAAAWSTAHHVPVMATEFGIFSAATQPTRVAWLGETRHRLEVAHIGWTVWEWSGGFGVAPLLPHSPLTDALGLN